MKFYINVIKRVMKAIFNNKVKVNILLYFTILTLELMICLNIIITIKDVNNKSSHIIDYILKVSIYIGNIIIFQSFFILKHESNQCILKQSFKIMT